MSTSRVAASGPPRRARCAPGSTRIVLSSDEIARIHSDPISPGASYAVARFEVEGRAGSILAEIDSDEFGERELRLLGGIAHQAKLAIANASSYEGLERTFVSTVEALANALEANDEYTSKHARWITDLALQRRRRARVSTTPR